MKKTTLAALITTFGLSGIAFVAMAQGPDRGPIPMLETVDANQDGDVSRAEIDAHRAARFADADINGDAQISSEEFEAFAEAERERRQEQRRDRRFSRLDANSDGVISAEEYAAADDARLDRMFTRIDANEDGVISEDEREAFKEQMKDRRGRRGMGRRG